MGPDDMELTEKTGGERQEKMVALLDRQGGMSVAALAHHFDCSTATVRRDLLRVEQSGIALVRYHGSVSLAREDLGSQFEARQISNYQAKQAIALLLADYIPERITIGLNGGTTTALVARAIAKRRKSVRVVTNAINIAYELALQSMDVVVVGGVVQLPHFESTGKVALSTLSDLHLDMAILGVEGVDSAFGFTTAREEEAAMCQTFRAIADEVITAWDSSKLGRKELFRLLDWSQVDYVAVNVQGGPELAHWPGLKKGLSNEEAELWKVKA